MFINDARDPLTIFDNNILAFSGFVVRLSKVVLLRGANPPVVHVYCRKGADSWDELVPVDDSTLTAIQEVLYTYLNDRHAKFFSSGVQRIFKVCTDPNTKESYVAIG